MRYLVPCIGLVAIALFGCQSGTHDLAFRPPHHTSYNLRWTTTGNMVMGLLGQKIATDMNNEINSLVQFDTLPDGKTQLSFRYRAYKMKQKVNGQEVSLDADNGSDTMAQNLLSNIMAIQFKAIANEQGKLTRITSGDSVWNLLEGGLQSLSGNEKARIGAPLRSLLNDDMFVGLMEQCFYLYPDRKIDVGDTWRNQIRMRSVFAMNINNSFELVDVKDGVAHIKLTSKVVNIDQPAPASGLAMASSPLRSDPPPNSGINMLGMQLDARFDGTQQGEFFVDIATGLLRNGFIKQNMQGMMKFNSMEFPMALDITSQYVLTKE